jgi:hypothetical protein
MEATSRIVLFLGIASLAWITLRGSLGFYLSQLGL